MKNILLFFFLYCNCFGQNPPIAIRIDTITSLDSIPSERKFAINYTIENLTDNEVSFFLNPNALISNSRASMSRFVSYKIYQDKEAIDIDNIFGNRKSERFEEDLKNAKTEEEKKIVIEKHLKEMNIDVASDLKKAKEDENYFWKRQNKDLLEDRITLNPNQKKSFTKTFSWDKKRYFKIDEVEYYIDEKIPHYFELSINLMKEEFKDKLSTEEFDKIQNDKSFIKGWFTSNKMEINFKE
jgi:hypothetical protein